MARPVYARIQDIRASGLSDETAWPDARILTLLEIASARVEALTSQFFGPRRLDFTRDGEGMRAVYEKNSNKIVELDVLSLVSPSTGAESIVPLGRYSITGGDRLVRLRWSFSGETGFHFSDRGYNALTPFTQAFTGLDKPRFPDNDNNVRLRGVWGWLEILPKIETTLAADLPKKGVAVTLTDATGIEDNDLLLIGDDTQAFWVVAGDDPTTEAPFTLPIDPSPRAAVSGAQVVRYGQVPLLLREAVIRTALANRFMPGSDQEQDQLNSKNVRREETDNYEIEFFAGPSGARLASGTGDPLADSILSDFRRPRISIRHC